MQEASVQCPYCGESIVLLIDCSMPESEQSYYEDCQVCCRPMLIELSTDHEAELISLQVLRDDS